MTTHSFSACWRVGRSVAGFFVGPPRPFSPSFLSSVKRCIARLFPCAGTPRDRSASVKTNDGMGRRRTRRPHVPTPRLLQVLLDPNPNLAIVPHRVLGLRQALVRRPPRPQVRLAIALLEYSLAPREVPPTQRQLALGVPPLRRPRIPRDRPPRIDRARQAPVLVARPELELRRRVPELARLRKELSRLRRVERDDGRERTGVAGRRCLLVEEAELVQRVRVVLVCLGGGALEPGDGDRKSVV